MNMEMLTASCTISAPEPGTEPRQEPCYVQQQQDNTDTVPCNFAGDVLNSLLSLIGIDVPAPKETETYSTSIYVKPKNSYTNLNISLTHGSLSDPVYDSGVVERKVSVSTGDFTEKNGEYFVDVAGKLNLVESDNIISVAWRGTPVDDDLGAISPKPTLSVDLEDKVKSSAPANGVILVKYDSLTINYRIDIGPREETGSGFYDSHLVVDDGGCAGRPSFYKINVPDCYERAQRIKAIQYGLYTPPRTSVEIERDPPSPPKGGEKYTCDYCLCTLDLKSESHDGLCPGSGQDPSDRCKSGPNHKDC
jgi:hypothetical protein